MLENRLTVNDFPHVFPRVDSIKKEAMLRGEYDPNSDEIISSGVEHSVSYKPRVYLKKSVQEASDFKEYCSVHKLHPISGYRGNNSEIVLMREGLEKFYRIGLKNGKTPLKMPVWQLVQTFNSYYKKHCTK